MASPSLKKMVTITFMIMISLPVLATVNGMPEGITIEDREINLTMEVPFELHFDPSELRMTEINGLTVITADGFSLPMDEGDAMLPTRPVSVLVHPWAQDIRIVIERTDASPLSVPSPIMGTPHAVPVGSGQTTQSSPASTLPHEPLVFLEQGSVRGYQVATFDHSPIIYSMAGLSVCERIEAIAQFEVEVSDLNRIEREPLRPDSAVLEMMGSRIENPEDIRSFGARPMWTPTRSLDSADVQYVIVTDTSKVNTAFTPLKEWKEKKGVPSRIVEMTYVKTNYTGVDNAEKLRNFIKDAVATWGTDYVLLGGDTSVVPYRGAYVQANGYSSTSSAADIYFSDLDGTFNSDGDSYWGETSDGVDLHPDVLVGRAPVQTKAEADAFVAKLLTYEKNPPSGYLDNATLAGEYLDDVTNSSVGLDNIKNNLLTSNYRATSLYDKAEGVFGNLNRANFMASVDRGASLIFHDGHCNWNVMSVGSAGGGDMYNGDIPNYKGGYKLGVLSSVGCIANKFDENDCIAELHVREPDGGTIAYIGNSHYGWYAYGSPGWGPSDQFQYRIAYELFKNSKYGIGTSFAAGKDYYVGYSGVYNSARWIQMVLNLIGDPEALTRTAEPKTFNVTLPQRLGIDVDAMDITVKGPSGTPVKSALVCLEQSGVFKQNRTNSQGKTLVKVPFSGKSEVNITITGYNFLPFISTIQMDTVKPRVLMGGSDGATTGDPYLVNCTLFDEFGIGKATVEFAADTPGSELLGRMELKQNGSFWTGELIVPLNCSGRLRLRIDAEDSSGNTNITDWTEVTVTDNDAPQLDRDNTPMRGTTGDVLPISLEITDNLGVSEATLEAGWEGEGTLIDTSMALLNGTWTYLLEAPSDKCGNLTYSVSAIDGAGNPALFGPRTISIVDDDAPVLIEDRSDASSTTSGLISFRALLEDNIGVERAEVEYSSASGRFSGRSNMTLSNEGVWEAQTELPEDSMETIQHVFEAQDASGNLMRSPMGSTVVKDDDPPVFISFDIPAVGSTGDRLDLKAEVSDNIGVLSVDAVMVFYAGRSEALTMSSRGGKVWTAAIIVPSSYAGTVLCSFEACDVSGNRNITNTLQMTISDNDPPEALWFQDLGKADAGSTVPVFAGVADNIATTSVSLVWWWSGDPVKYENEMAREGEGSWGASITLPEHAYGTLYYYVEAEDASGNLGRSQRQEAGIEEMLLPPPDDDDDDERVPTAGEDLDMDGMDDLWEHQNGLDLTKDDSLDDVDRDGYDNLEEFMEGSDPRDPADRPFQGYAEDRTDDLTSTWAVLGVIGAACLVLILVLLLIAIRKARND